jgi:hypothetical protein
MIEMTDKAEDLVRERLRYVAKYIGLCLNLKGPRKDIVKLCKEDDRGGTVTNMYINQADAQVILWALEALEEMDWKDT